MMHNWDLFEPWKRLTTGFAIEFTLTKPIAEIDLDGAIEHVKKVLESENYRVVALWMAHDPTKHWVDWSTKAISNGQQWGMLAEYLEQFGIKEPAETKTS